MDATKPVDKIVASSSVNATHTAADGRRPPVLNVYAASSKRLFLRTRTTGAATVPRRVSLGDQIAPKQAQRADVVRANPTDTAIVAPTMKVPRANPTERFPLTSATVPTMSRSSTARAHPKRRSPSRANSAKKLALVDARDTIFPMIDAVKATITTARATSKLDIRFDYLVASKAERISRSTIS